MTRLAASAAAILAAGPASARTPFVSGLDHPLSGTDHILAMVALGLLAAVAGGPARLAFPAAFLASVAAGLLLGAGGLALPGAEPMILASIFVLSALLAMGARPPLAGGMVMAALFGFVHGSAQQAGVGPAAFPPFAAGVLAGTVLLLLLGLSLASSLLRLLGRTDARLPLGFLGAGLGLGGLALAFG